MGGMAQGSCRFSYNSSFCTMSAETPEQKARLEIDRQLTQSGWKVQHYRQMNIHVARGVAVGYFRLTNDEEADYLLYVDGKVIGVVEAKPEGFTLKGVEIQSDKYTKGLQPSLPAIKTVKCS
jgi:type I restriction enzyme, R subunit